MKKLVGFRVHARSASRCLNTVAGVLAFVLAGVSAASGEMFVTNLNDGSVTTYGRTAQGNTAPVRKIIGLAAPQGIAATNNELFVANSGGSSITVYSRTASGYASALRTITGPSTLLSAPRGLALDVAGGELFVANFGDGSITVYSLTANGDAAPIRRIAGAATGLSVPEGLALDLVNNELAVADIGNYSIRIFSSKLNGNVAPLRVITGAATLLSTPVGLVVDTAHDELIVANLSSVRTYSRTATGNVAPLRSIAGAATGLGFVPIGIALDSDLDQLVVAVQNGSSIRAFDRTASGNVAPVRTISGGVTELNFPQFVALVSSPSVPAALEVDPAGNRVLEPGESVVVSPSWTNETSTAAPPLTGTAASFTGPAGAMYGINDGSADYGALAGGATASCGANCYSVGVSIPAARPSLHWDATFSESVSTGDPKDWSVHVGHSFGDVSTFRGDYRFIETLLHNQVSTGCGAGNFCPDTDVTRGQMAVFLLRSAFGPAHTAPPCPGATFTDVPCSSPYAPWVYDLVAHQVTVGCGGGLFCLGSPVTRGQLAVFLLRTQGGPTYVPPPCVTPTFADVPCANPLAAWVNELAARGIAAGCGPGNYCPASSVTRGQMAVFLTTTFGLKLYGL